MYGLPSNRTWDNLWRTLLVLGTNTYRTLLDCIWWINFCKSHPNALILILYTHPSENCIRFMMFAEKLPVISHLIAWTNILLWQLGNQQLVQIAWLFFLFYFFFKYVFPLHSSFKTWPPTFVVSRINLAINRFVFLPS